MKSKRESPSRIVAAIVEKRVIGIEKKIENDTKRVDRSDLLIEIGITLLWKIISVKDGQPFLVISCFHALPMKKSSGPVIGLDDDDRLLLGAGENGVDGFLRFLGDKGDLLFIIIDILFNVLSVRTMEMISIAVKKILGHGIFFTILFEDKRRVRGQDVRKNEAGAVWLLQVGESIKSAQDAPAVTGEK